jgi:hypothetical protein
LFGKEFVCSIRTASKRQSEAHAPVFVFVW